MEIDEERERERERDHSIETFNYKMSPTKKLPFLLLSFAPFTTLSETRFLP
jgi:hypothetical protein